jgi:nucleotide-binding universal stress UspA family protein
MGRYRKILVAVDGSDSSKNAFRQACRIAREDKSWLTVITVIPLYQDQFETLSAKEMISKKLREESEKILSEIKKIADEENTFIKLRLEEGNPFDTIIDVSTENNYDLIVMGRHGRTALERMLVGGVTARVIGHSQKDVLVIPRNAVIGWKNILLATDGSRYSDAAAERAIDLAKNYGGNIKTVSVVDVTDEFHALAPEVVEKLVKEAKTFVENVKKKAETSNVNIDTLVREGDAYKVITGLARDEKADVIVIGSHGRTGLKRLLMGSVTEKVIGHSTCPVLVVKA